MDDNLSIQSSFIPSANLPGTASLCIGVLLPSFTDEKNNNNVLSSSSSTVSVRSNSVSDNIPNSLTNTTGSVINNQSTLVVTQEPPIVQIQTKNETNLQIDIDLIYNDNIDNSLPNTTTNDNNNNGTTTNKSIVDTNEEDNETELDEEEDFYEQTLDPLITSVLEGINASLLLTSVTSEGFLRLLGGPNTNSSTNNYIFNQPKSTSYNCPLRKRKRNIHEDNIYIDMNQINGCLSYIGHSLTAGITQITSNNNHQSQQNGYNHSMHGSSTVDTSYMYSNTSSQYDNNNNYPSSSSSLINTAQLQISALCIIDPDDGDPILVDLLQDISLTLAPGIPFITALRQQQQLAHQSAFEIMIDDEIGPYVRNASLHGPIVSIREMNEILNFITTTYDRIIQKLNKPSKSSPSSSNFILPSIIVQFTVTQGSGATLINARNNMIRSQFIVAGLSLVTPYMTQLAQKAANLTHILPLPLSISAGSKLWPLFGNNNNETKGKENNKSTVDLLNSGPTSGTFTALADLATAQTAHPVTALLSECFGSNYLTICLFGLPSNSLSSSSVSITNTNNNAGSTSTALVPTDSTKEILEFLHIFRTCRCYPVSNTANIRMLQRQQRALIRQLRNNSGFLGQVLGGLGSQISLDTEERILTLQDNLLQYTLENETLRSEVDHLQNELQNRPTNQDIADYTSEIHTLRRNLGSKAEEIRLLREQIKVYQEELSMAPPEIKEMQDSRDRRTLLVSYILGIRRRLALLTPDPIERQALEATAALAVASPTHATVPTTNSSSSPVGTDILSLSPSEKPTIITNTDSLSSFDPLTLEDRILQEAKDGLGSSVTINTTKDSTLAAEIMDSSSGTFVNYSTLLTKLKSQLDDNSNLRTLNTNMRNQLIRARDALLAAKQAREAYQNPFKATLQGTAGEREATTKAMRILRGHLLRVQDRAETLQVENDRLRAALGESADRIKLVADLASARENTNPNNSKKSSSKRTDPNENNDDTNSIIPSSFEYKQSKAMQESLMKQLKQSEQRTIELLRENALLNGQTEGLKEQLKNLVTRYESAMARLRTEVETLRARLINKT